MASIYRRGNWWWISYYLNSKLIQHSLKVKDRKFALHLKKEKELEIEKGRARIPIHKKVSNVLEEYKNYSYLKKTSENHRFDISQLNKFIKFANITYLKDIKTSVIQSYLQNLAKENKKPKTINNYFTVIKAFLNYAKNRGYIYENPANPIKKLKIPKNPPRYLSKEEIQRLLKVAEGSHLYPLIVTALYTGLRIGELISLEWKDVNFGNRTITVKGTKAKSKVFRIIPIHQKVYDILHSLRKNEGYVFAYKDKRYSEPPKRAFKTLLRHAGIEKVGFHTLRHSCASWLIMNGVDIYTVSKILGHSQVTTTQIYAHLTPDYLKKAMDLLTF